jgi:hypothetical protein
VTRDKAESVLEWLYDYEPIQAQPIMLTTISSMDNHEPQLPKETNLGLLQLPKRKAVQENLA